MYQYMNNNNITCASDFLFRREDGILEIKEGFKDSLNKLMYNYFSNRNEDIGN